MNPFSSISENNGIEMLSENDQKIYSVGISTGGIAEIRMAAKDRKRRIIATTLDPSGEEFARKKIALAGFSKQIEVKIEDVSKPLPYAENYFDCIYARLVLHYLQKSDLQNALNELYRILKPDGKLFTVVRSVDCFYAKDKNSEFDPETCLTKYYYNEQPSLRYFHSEESISHFLKSSKFAIKYSQSYEERLCVDFERTLPAQQVDTLIETLAIKK